MSKTRIGDVLVREGEPPEGNPYRGHGLSGPDREDALIAFRDGTDDGRHTYWCAPASGGARRLTDPDDVNWEAMR